MSKFSCKETCKKTSQLRESEHCSGTCETISGKLVFGCDESLKANSCAESNFRTCQFWDMGIKDNCVVCPLHCKENKNPIVKNANIASKNITSILDSLGPIVGMFGVDPSVLKKAQQVMNSKDNTTNNSEEIDESIKLANYAKDLINSIMSGKQINIAEFQNIKSSVEKKYKK